MRLLEDQQDAVFNLKKIYLYKRWNYHSIKENGKLFGIKCTGLLNECDVTKGLSCLGTSTSKTCA